MSQHAAPKRTLSKVSQPPSSTPRPSVTPHINKKPRIQDAPVRNCSKCSQPLKSNEVIHHPPCTYKKITCYFDNKTNRYDAFRKPDGKIACPRCHIDFINANNLRNHCRQCELPLANRRLNSDNNPNSNRAKPLSQSDKTMPSMSSSQTLARSLSVTTTLPALSSPSISRASSPSSMLLSPANTGCTPQLNNASLIEQQQTLNIDTVPNQIEVVQPPLLRSLGLIINTRFNVVICIQCTGIIDPSRVLNHLRDKHPAIQSPHNTQEIFDIEIRDKYPNLTYNPTEPTNLILPVYGLGPPVPNYMLCSECSRCFKSPKNFKQHSCTLTHPTNERNFIKCHAQRFIDNNSRSWFAVEVTSHTRSSPVDSPWSLYRKTIASRSNQSPPATSFPDNYRILHQFLYKEHWLDHVGLLEHEDLMHLVSYSSQDPIYGNLHRHIHHFLAGTQAKLDSHYLRRLIGTRPASEHSVTYQRHHSDVGYETHDKYSRVLAGAIMLLIRNATESHELYKFNLTESEANACKMLVNNLQPPTPAEIVAQEGRSEYIPDPAASLESDWDWLDDGSHDDDLHQDDTNKPTSNTSYGVAELRRVPESSNLVQKPLITLLTLLFTLTPSGETRGPFHNPLMRYLLLSSLRGNRSWAPASVITQNIAALLFIGRLTLGSILIEQMKLNPNSTYHHLYHHIQPYLEESAEAIMPSLYILLRGLSGLHSADHSMLLFNAPDVSGTSAIFGDQHLSLASLKCVHVELIEEIQKEMDNLLFHDPRFELPDNLQIYDEPRERKPGYSFVTDTRNAWNHQTTLLQHILETENLFHRFAYLDVSGNVQWMPGACADRMKRIFDLQTKIMLAIILTYGEPARAVEILSHLLCNVPGGSTRNSFVMFQVFILRGSYNKTSHVTSSDKSMVRVPLPIIGRLFIRFLVYLRPLYSEWQYQLRPSMHFSSVHYLFPGLYRPLTSYDLSSFLSKLASQRLNIKLNLRTYRQFMAFITSCNAEIFEIAERHTNAAHEQLGHSGQTNRDHYGHDARVPEGLDQSLFMSTARVSAIFHILYGHPPHLLELLEAGKARISELAAIIQSIRNPVIPHIEYPSSSSAKAEFVAEIIKDIIVPEIEKATKSVVAKSHASIVRLYNPNPPIANPRSLPQVAEICTHPYILVQLRKFMPTYGPDLGFVNIQQAQVTQLMYQAERHIAYIAPTGSGKTTPGLLSAKHLDDGKSTLWILPLVAMHEQYHLRSKAHQMTCESWSYTTSSLTPPTHILVTIDQTEYESFRTFVHTLRYNNRIARAIVDEAHIVLTHDSFRPIMSVLQWLGQEGIQLVLQTATLPPSLEENLFRAMGLTSTVVCRIKTPRPNISFNVIRSDSSLQGTLQLEFSKAMDATTLGKILIFCLTKRDAETYASLLDIPFCHAGLDPTEISSMLKRFRAEDSLRALACTSILGVALDEPQVTHVIHVDFPRDMIAFVQEVGRAGRDFQRSRAWSIVILPPKIDFPQYPDNDRFGAYILHQSLLDATTCRRLAPQLFIDGVAEPCSMMEANTHLCDVCLRQSKEKPSRSADNVFPQGLLSFYPTTGVSNK